MKTRTRTVILSALLGLGVVLLAACERTERAAPDADMPMEGMPMEGMPMDQAMMARHADEAAAMTEEVRAHLSEMRRFSAEEQHTRMVEHVRQVSAMLALMNRQMQEMSMGMPMDDVQMGAMMGMSGEEHRRMVEEMDALRAELETLQTAPVGEVQQRMAAHLERCERMAGMLERSAEHMRRR